MKASSIVNSDLQSLDKANFTDYEINNSLDFQKAIQTIMKVRTQNSDSPQPIQTEERLEKFWDEIDEDIST